MAAAPSGPSLERAATVPRSSESIIVEERRRDVVVGERPAPASFTDNANVSPIYFDSTATTFDPATRKRCRATRPDMAW